MIRFIAVKIHGPFPGSPNFRRTHNAAMKAGHAMMGEHWIHGGIRAAHFTPQAHFVYGYAQRGAGYMKKKQALTGQNADLVYSGESARETSYSRVVPTSVRAVMRIPSGQFNRQVSHIDMRGELLRMTDRDHQSMAGVFQSAYQIELTRQSGDSATVISSGAAA